MSESLIKAEIVSPVPLRPQDNVSYAQIPVKEKLESFLNRSTSANTRSTERGILLEFNRFVGRHLLTVTERDVRVWRDKLLAAAQAEQTVASKLAIVRSFYNYLQKFYPDLIPINPADTDLVPPPRVSGALKGRALSAKEVKHLLVGPDRKTPEGARDYALMLVMLRLSLRVSECGRMKRSNIKWAGKCFTLRLKVKGGAEEVWPLPPDVKEAIDLYLRMDEKRRSLWRENYQQDQYVFQPFQNYRTGQQNRGLTRQMIANIVRKWADFVGIEGRVTPHNLRATAITRALEKGRSYRDVQMMSKHRDPKTVMKYDYGRDNLENNPVNTLSYDDE